MGDQRLKTATFQASFARYALTKDMHGPFHRLENGTTQTAQIGQVMAETGMLWGATPRGGKCPTAQAYFGPLPAGQHGVEFVTSVRPYQENLPQGFGANWHLEDTAFTGKISRNGCDYAAIPIIVLRLKP